jgi:ketosteroid isomerase-like protein
MMDHAATTRHMYELLSNGDVDGFGKGLADDFVEHEETPGLAHEHWGIVDTMTMMQQLGVVPDGPPA